MPQTGLCTGVESPGTLPHFKLYGEHREFLFGHDVEMNPGFRLMHLADRQLSFVKVKVLCIKQIH